MSAKPMPKSLHTVTALANFGAYLADTQQMPLADAVREAAAILGYESSDDAYGLAARAVAILEAGK